MKKWFFVPILCLFLVVCLKPERDNPNDEYYSDPDKVYLGGTVYDFNGSPLEDATIKLFKESEYLSETNSDNEGWYEFTGLEPGKYKLHAEARYYTPLEIGPLNLVRGDKLDTLDFYFNEMFFDFENDPLGESNPHGWHEHAGHWEIFTDGSGQAYGGVNSSGVDEYSLAKLNDPIADFWMDTKLKVLSSSTSGWEAGMVLRYQDDRNFYLVSIEHFRMGVYLIIDGYDSTLALVDTFFPPEQWVYLAADCDENSIDVYLEGELIFEISDNTFSKGYAGLFVKTWNEPGSANVGFDDIGFWSNYE